MAEYINRAYALEVIRHISEDEPWQEACVNNVIRLLNELPSIDIDDYIPIEYVKDFCKDCADEGIGTVSTYMEDAGEAIVKSWLAVKNTDFGKKYKR